MKKETNIIFFGEFPYPHGMAGTRRVQHAITGLQKHSNTSVRVIIFRQFAQHNPPRGIHNNVRYETISSYKNLHTTLILLPLSLLKAYNKLKKALIEHSDNIMYCYGPPKFFTIVPLYFAKKLGYKIFFDIVEDYDEAASISNSITHRVKIFTIKHLENHLKKLATGIIVISSHLQKKYEKYFNKKIPVHHRPISIDSKQFATIQSKNSSIKKMFYAGSFAKKDGVPILLNAFNILAKRHHSLHLILTGKGSNETLQPLLSQIASSPFNDRIEYKGYLCDDDYYKELASADIPCMTRVDTKYANAGFPFKLGEFLATAKPVIASMVSDIPEILLDRHDAMLINPGEVEAIVNAIDYLLTNPNKAISIGRNGREKALQLFDIDRQSSLLLKFFQTSQS